MSAKYYGTMLFCEKCQSCRYYAYDKSAADSTGKHSCSGSISAAASQNTGTKTETKKECPVYAEKREDTNKGKYGVGAGASQMAGSVGSDGTVNMEQLAAGAGKVALGVSVAAAKAAIKAAKVVGSAIKDFVSGEKLYLKFLDVLDDAQFEGDNAVIVKGLEDALHVMEMSPTVGVMAERHNELFDLGFVIAREGIAALEKAGYDQKNLDKFKDKLTDRVVADVDKSFREMSKEFTESGSGKGRGRFDTALGRVKDGIVVLQNMNYDPRKIDKVKDKMAVAMAGDVEKLLNGQKKSLGMLMGIGTKSADLGLELLKSYLVELEGMNFNPKKLKKYQAQLVKTEAKIAKQKKKMKGVFGKSLIKLPGR
jgi:hypothetical protein